MIPAGEGVLDRRTYCGMRRVLEHSMVAMEVIVDETEKLAPGHFTGEAPEIKATSFR
jgi:hypothetical protein